MRPKIERLKDTAWKTFSEYIRLRDKKCITCNCKSEQAGHFWHTVLDFDEENVNGQCIRCNHFLSGNLAVYAVYLLKKLGKKKFDALDIRHTRALGGEKRYEKDFEDIIKKYKEKIKQLNEKSL